MELNRTQFGDLVRFHIHEAYQDQSHSKKEFTVAVDFGRKKDGFNFRINKIQFYGTLNYRYSVEEKKLRINSQFLRRADRGYGKDDLTAMMYSEICDFSETTIMDFLKDPEVEIKLRAEKNTSEILELEETLNDLEVRKNQIRQRLEILKKC
jgi:hypothetical protein